MQKNRFLSGLDQFLSGFGPVFLKTSCNYFGPVLKQSSPVNFQKRQKNRTGLDFKTLYLMDKNCYVYPTSTLCLFLGPVMLPPTWPQNSLFNGQELLCIPHLYIVSLTWATLPPTWPHNSLFNGQELLCIPHLYVVSLTWAMPPPTWPHNSLFNGQELLCIPYLYVVSLTWASSTTTNLASQLPTY